jgi:hypothetical protein
MSTTTNDDNSMSGDMNMDTNEVPVDLGTLDSAEQMNQIMDLMDHSETVSSEPRPLDDRMHGIDTRLTDDSVNDLIARLDQQATVSREDPSQHIRLHGVPTGDVGVAQPWKDITPVVDDTTEEEPDGDDPTGDVGVAQPWKDITPVVDDTTEEEPDGDDMTNGVTLDPDETLQYQYEPTVEDQTKETGETKETSKAMGGRFTLQQMVTFDVYWKGETEMTDDEALDISIQMNNEKSIKQIKAYHSKRVQRQTNDLVSTRPCSHDRTVLVTHSLLSCLQLTTETEPEEPKKTDVASSGLLMYNPKSLQQQRLFEFMNKGNIFLKRNVFVDMNQFNKDLEYCRFFQYTPHGRWMSSDPTEEDPGHLGAIPFAHLKSLVPFWYTFQDYFITWQSWIHVMVPGQINDRQMPDGLTFHFHPDGFPFEMSEWMEVCQGRDHWRISSTQGTSTYKYGRWTKGKALLFYLKGQPQEKIGFWQPHGTTCLMTQRMNGQVPAFPPAGRIMHGIMWGDDTVSLMTHAIPKDGRDPEDFLEDLQKNCDAALDSVDAYSSMASLLRLPVNVYQSVGTAWQQRKKNWTKSVRAMSAVDRANYYTKQAATRRENRKEKEPMPIPEDNAYYCKGCKWAINGMFSVLSKQCSVDSYAAKCPVTNCDKNMTFYKLAAWEEQELKKVGNYPVGDAYYCKGCKWAINGMLFESSKKCTVDSYRTKCPVTNCGKNMTFYKLAAWEEQELKKVGNYPVDNAYYCKGCKWAINGMLFELSKKCTADHFRVGCPRTRCGKYMTFYKLTTWEELKGVKAFLEKYAYYCIVCKHRHDGRQTKKNKDCKVGKILAHCPKCKKRKTFKKWEFLSH